MRTFVVLVAMTATASAAPSEACKKELSDLGAFVTKAGAETAHGVLHADSHDLVERDDLPAVSHMQIVEVSATNVYVGAGNAEMPTEKKFALERQIQDDPDYAKMSPGLAGHPHELAWLIDKDTPWRNVVAALDAAQKNGFDHVQFVFATKPMAAPPHTAVDDAVAKAGRGMSGISTAIAPFAKSAMAKCPHLVRAFDPPSGDDWIAKHFWPDLDVALEGCDCGVAMDELRSVLYYMLVPRPKTGALSITLAKSGTAVSAAKTALWKDVAPKIKSGKIHVSVK
ncbi:MAG TPA: hypothetical protein VGM39_25225 [Kofleriaceae bacterium]